MVADEVPNFPINSKVKMKQTNQSFIYPLPNLQIIEKQSLSTKKERKKCFTNFERPPKTPVRSCPVSRTRATSVFHNSCPRPVSFKDDPDASNTLITDNPMYTSTKGTYFEQCFTTESTLGKGSFGEVFKVFSKETEKAYACKRTILKYRGQSDRNRMIQEVRKHEELPTHLNCVEFFRAWEEKNHLYLLTEVCQFSLADVMANNHELPEHQIWSYLVDILQGLHHLHNHKLIHMDVKPENIFVGIDGLCKLGDFGLVIDFSKGYPLEAVEGDPKYLAPECLQNIYTPAADMFSLGIVLLEMATDLFLPHAGPQWHKLRNGNLPQVAKQKMSEDFQYVVEGFINPDHKQRFTTHTVLSEIKPVYRIARKKRVSQYLKQKISEATNRVYAILCWPFSILLAVFSFISFGKFDHVLQLRQETNSDQEEECANESDLLCNLSYGDISDLPGPLTNSTPISHIKKRGLISKFLESDVAVADSSGAYSFHDSSFSSLEMSNEDLVKNISKEEFKSASNPKDEEPVRPRNLLVSFNSALNDEG